MKIILSQSHSPYLNLATEEYLFSAGEDDYVLMYVNEPSVIVGANQILANEVNVPFCKEKQIQIARRMSGGGTVFHDGGNLNYCFITCKSTEKAAMDTDFLKPVVEVLMQLNIQAQVGKRKDLWLPGGFKISGTASHISKNRVLFHGTLLYDTKLEILEKALTVKEKNTAVKGIASVPSPVKNIKTYLFETGDIQKDKNDFFVDFIHTMAEYFQAQAEFLNAENLVEIQKLAENKYLKEEWIFRK